jgi:cell division protein FtsQ
MKKASARWPARVSEFRVEGMKALSSPVAKELSSLWEGKSLFGSFVSRSKEAVQTLGQNPRVANVTVLRDMTGQVLVKVAERQPAALVNLDRLYYVDREGLLLDPVTPDSSEAANLVILTGDWGKMKVGMAERLKPRLRNGLDLLAALQDAGFRQKEISELHQTAMSVWVVYLVGSGIPILVGSDRFETKALRLKRVVKDLEAQKVSVKEIDLDYRDRVVVKLKT